MKCARAEKAFLLAPGHVDHDFDSQAGLVGAVDEDVGAGEVPCVAPHCEGQHGGDLVRVPKRFSAAYSTIFPEPWSSSSWPMSVSKDPGDTDRTRAPFAPNSAAIFAEYRITNPLELE